MKIESNQSVPQEGLSVILTDEDLRFLPLVKIAKLKEIDRLKDERIALLTQELITLKAQTDWEEDSANAAAMNSLRSENARLWGADEAAKKLQAQRDALLEALTHEGAEVVNRVTAKAGELRS